ncbi:hypothetical protein [Planomicrobium sp. CPCC 101110]|uniref:hypothetical protein n=1 Tax=Planomicrobium sp. CPCC 101110 TaxID=2599619 RepID=UPI0011B65913|nr:hypothetical protein [Planomicrobium sp. CPCC 101110]TWT25815.1 hypothetical protein FQV30_08425 [Planomicrobium sp. CPCC 101110]
MKLEHIKSLLELSCTFNFSFISHSFTIGVEETLTVKCLKDTYILEVTSTENQQVDYYTSIDQAAEALYYKIHGHETD